MLGLQGSSSTALYLMCFSFQTNKHQLLSISRQFFGCLEILNKSSSQKIWYSNR